MGACSDIEGILLTQNDVEREAAGIVCGYCQGLSRYVPSLNVSLWQALLDAEGYASATRTDVKNAQGRSFEGQGGHKRY